jgi:hypothetical protein
MPEITTLIIYAFIYYIFTSNRFFGSSESLILFVNKFILRFLFIFILLSPITFDNAVLIPQYYNSIFIFLLIGNIIIDTISYIKGIPKQ